MVPSHSNNGNSFFFVAKGEQAEINSISFGDEGQHWKLMRIEDYLSHPEAIPALITRLNGYLNR
jgi:8-oxo-dGTP diphosphatase